MSVDLSAQKTLKAIGTYDLGAPLHLYFLVTLRIEGIETHDDGEVRFTHTVGLPLGRS